MCLRGACGGGSVLAGVRGGCLWLLALTVGLLGSVAVAFAGSAVAAVTTVAFTTQGCTTWTVPTGVGSVQIQAIGAAGGGAGGGAGGVGDGVSGAVSSLAGGTQVLDVCVDQGSGGIGGGGNCFDGGGGGGGGYFGGGGGSGSGFGGGGGGGGTDFCADSIVSCTVSSGAGTQTMAGGGTGDAQLTITYALTSTGVSAPGSAAPGTAIAAGSISATLSGASSAASGTITFTVFGPQSSPPTELHQRRHDGRDGGRVRQWHLPSVGWFYAG
jgi:hypothetical protein